MAKKQATIDTANLEEAADSVGNLICDAADAIRKGASGDTEQLRELQSALVRLARDATDAACCLFTAIRTAESRDELARLAG